MHFLTLGTSEFTCETEVKKSRFIAHLARVDTEAKAREVIETVRKTHWSASHNCTAFSIGAGDTATKRSSDDGEPSGTAGVPMLEALAGRNFGDLVVVVTRYYGGIQLGAGGLVRAYGGAVLDAIDTARAQGKIVRRAQRSLYQFEAMHAEAGRIEADLRNLDPTIAQLTSVDYAARVTFTLAIGADASPDALVAHLASSTKGAANPVPCGSEWVDGPL